MDNKLLETVIENLGLKSNRLTIVKNSDGFFKMPELKSELNKLDVELLNGSTLELRVHFELNFKQNNYLHFVYVVADKNDLFEDMLNAGFYTEFEITSLFPEYYADSILKCTYIQLCQLYTPKPLITLSEPQTNEYIENIKQKINNNFENTTEQQAQNLISYFSSISESANEINWENLIVDVSGKLSKAIELRIWDDIKPFVENLNTAFQSHLKSKYKAHILPASFVKRPSIVSSVLPFLHFNYKAHEKVALIVIDGMAYWQYIMLSEQLGNGISINNDAIYSWIPSITQLSRQSLFRGAAPVSNYVQNPGNEANLWKLFWKSKGFIDAQVHYCYNTLSTESLHNIKRLAFVDVTLDDKMHASTDYNDLFDLTQNWLENSEIISTIQHLISDDFTIFVTTDHGNIQAQGLNFLTQQERLGTNKSGSRSLRHLEYSDNWLKEQFMKNHTDWNSILCEYESSIVLNDNSAFCADPKLVTHGGSHFLEVLIPFITLRKNNNESN